MKLSSDIIKGKIQNFPMTLCQSIVQNTCCLCRIHWLCGNRWVGAAWPPKYSTPWLLWTPINFKMIFCPWKHKELASKVAYLWQFGFFSLCSPKQLRGEYPFCRFFFPIVCGTVSGHATFFIYVTFCSRSNKGQLISE